MSGTLDAHEPECLQAESESIQLVIEAKPRDLGGFSVRRALPSMKRRMIGPFIFFDQMGPATLPLDQGLDVRPHPHIGLATVTYLFEGEIVHKDSLGSDCSIRPGDVNWMHAGKGIVHSERSQLDERKRGVRIHGIQSWVALPIGHEESDPWFEHHPGSAIPKVAREGAALEILAGTAFGATSPVTVLAPTLYVHARLEAGARLLLDAEHEQRAVYVVEGEIGCDQRPFTSGTMVVLRPDLPVTIHARSASRLMILGGARLEGERHIFWNFVSSRMDRLDQAKEDWNAERFPRVPGDELERIPLPSR